MEHAVPVAVPFHCPDDDESALTESPWRVRPVYFTLTEWNALFIDDFIRGRLPSAQLVGPAPIVPKLLSGSGGGGGGLLSRSKTEPDAQEEEEERNALQYSQAGEVARDMALYHKVLVSPAAGKRPAHILRYLGATTAVFISADALLRGEEEESCSIRPGAVEAVAALAVAVGVPGIAPALPVEKGLLTPLRATTLESEEPSPLHVTDEIGIFGGGEPEEEEEENNGGASGSGGDGGGSNVGEADQEDASQEDEGYTKEPRSFGEGRGGAAAAATSSSASWSSSLSFSFSAAAARREVTKSGAVFLVASTAVQEPLLVELARAVGLPTLSGDNDDDNNDAHTSDVAPFPVSVVPALRGAATSLPSAPASSDSASAAVNDIDVERSGGGDGAAAVRAAIREARREGHVVTLVGAGGRGSAWGGARAESLVGVRGGAHLNVVIQTAGATVCAAEDAADVLVLVGKGEGMVGGGRAAAASSAAASSAAHAAAATVAPSSSGFDAFSRLAAAVELARTVAFDDEAFQGEKACSMCTLA